MAIAHLAGPRSVYPSDPEPVMRLTIEGTKSILHSAVEHAGEHLKCVVLLSSIGAIRSFSKPEGHKFTEEDWNDFAEDIVREKGKDAPGPFIYAASKTAQERLFWRFREEKKPSFAMGAINPG